MALTRSLFRFLHFSQRPGTPREHRRGEAVAFLPDVLGLMKATTQGAAPRGFPPGAAPRAVRSRGLSGRRRRSPSAQRGRLRPQHPMSQPPVRPAPGTTAGPRRAPLCTGRSCSLCQAHAGAWAVAVPCRVSWDTMAGWGGSEGGRAPWLLLLWLLTGRSRPIPAGSPGKCRRESRDREGGSVWPHSPPPVGMTRLYRPCTRRLCRLPARAGLFLRQ